MTSIIMFRMKNPGDKEKRQRQRPEPKGKKAPGASQEMTQSGYITERLNEIYSKESSTIDWALYCAQIESLKRQSW
jgi:hypothetical protein